MRDDPAIVDRAATYLRRPVTGVNYAEDRKARDSIPKARYDFAHRAQRYARHCTRMLYDDEYAERHRARLRDAQRRHRQIA
jgi:hypothetical protein